MFIYRIYFTFTFIRFSFTLLHFKFKSVQDSHKSFKACLEKEKRISIMLSKLEETLESTKTGQRSTQQDTKVQFTVLSLPRKKLKSISGASCPLIKLLKRMIKRSKEMTKRKAWAQQTTQLFRHKQKIIFRRKMNGYV